MEDTLENYSAEIPGIDWEKNVAARQLGYTGEFLLKGVPATWIGITAYEFSERWRRAYATLSIPRQYTPHSLPRRGATSPFVWCGKCDGVRMKGPWQSTQAMRAYLNQALLDPASGGKLKAWHE